MLRGNAVNILQIGELYSYGGATEVMELLGGELKEKGCGVHYVYGYNYHKAPVKKDHYVLFQNSIIRGINNRILFLLERFNLPNLYARNYINRLIKSQKIELIHMHAMQGGFLGIKDIEYFAKRYPVVWTFHDSWALTGGCMCYWDCTKWSSDKCKDCVAQGLLTKYKNTHVNYLRKESAFKGKNITFVTPSKWMQNNLLNSYLSNEINTVVNNGIDMKIFNKIDELKYDDNKIRLMFVASTLNDPFKGWKYLKEALQQLKNPEKYKLLVVGEVTTQLDDVDIDKECFGYVRDKERLNEIYNMADIFITPSVQDNFPTVVLEAQAAGTPVVAFPTGGIVEQITEDTGWIVEEKSGAALARMIEEIADASDFKEIIKQKGQNASARSQKLYNKELMADRYFEIYKDRLENEIYN